MLWYPKLNTDKQPDLPIMDTADFFNENTTPAHIFLSQLSKMIMTEDGDFKETFGVPDIFHKAFLFDMPFKPAAQGVADDAFLAGYKKWVSYEWRAIITVLLLAENLDIKIKTVSFFPDELRNGLNDTENSLRELLNNNTISLLDKILYKRIPNSKPWSIPSGEQNISGWTWHSGVVFLIKHKTEDKWAPIAITSPTTLVVPAADAWDTIRTYGYEDKIPWLKSFHADTTVGLKNLNDTNPVKPIVEAYGKYVAFMCEWLELYREKLTKLSRDDRWCSNPDTLNYLLDANTGLISEFISELGTSDIKTISDKRIRQFERRYENMGMLSFCASNENETEFDGYIGDTTLVIDCSNTDLNSIVISGLDGIRTVQELVDKYNAVGAEKLKNNYQKDIYLSDSLFEDTITYAYYETSENCCNVNGWVKYADNYLIKLPFTEEYRQLSEKTENLQPRFTIRLVKDTVHVVEIDVSIDVQQSSSPKKILKLEKTFKLKDIRQFIDCSIKSNILDLEDTLFIDFPACEKIGRCNANMFVTDKNLVPISFSLDKMKNNSERVSATKEANERSLKLVFSDEIFEKEIALAWCLTEKTYGERWIRTEGWGNNFCQIKLPFNETIFRFVEKIKLYMKGSYKDYFSVSDSNADVEISALLKIPMNAFVSPIIIKEKYSKNGQTKKILLYLDCQIAEAENTFFIDYTAPIVCGFSPKNVMMVFGEKGYSSFDDLRNCYSLEELRVQRKYISDNENERSDILAMIEKDRTVVFSHELWLKKVYYSYLRTASGERVYADAIGLTQETVKTCNTFPEIEKYVDGNEYKQRIKILYWVPMPLSEDGFSLFKAQPNAYSFSVSSQNRSFGDLEEISVSFKISMKSIPDLTTPPQIYSVKNESAIPLNPLEVMTCGVWPKQKVEGWRIYYLFVREDDYSLCPKDCTFEQKSEQGESNRYKYYMMGNFPEYLMFYNTRNADNPLGYIRLNTSEMSIEDAHSEKDIYKAAVDFGTSSTVIFKKMGDNTIEDLSWEKIGSGAVFYIPIREDEKSLNIDFFSAYFIPHFRKKFPSYFQTLLHDYIKNNDDFRERNHILDAVIFNRQMLPEESTDSVVGRVDSNLKWGSKYEATNPRIRVFYKQIARYILLDALINGFCTINVWASYPSAKAKRKVQVFELKGQLLNSVKEDLKQPQSVPGEPSQLSGLKKYVMSDTKKELFYDMSEGVAAAHSFQSDSKITFRCIIDIGAGTTDYFVHRKSDSAKRVARDSSVKFGARDILVDLLFELTAEREFQDNDSMLSYLANKVQARTKIPQEAGEYIVSQLQYIRDIWGKSNSLFTTFRDLHLNKSSGKRGQDDFRSLLEYYFALDTKLVNEIGEPITLGEVLPCAFSKETDGQKDFERKFMTMLAIGVSSLVYYAGMLAASIAQDTSETFNDASENVVLEFAGNGSKILNWFRGDNKIKKFLQIVFICGLNMKDTPETICNLKEWSVDCKPYSRRAKLEVVSGMLEQDKDLQDMDKNRETVCLAGERFKGIDGVDYLATKNIDETTMFPPRNAENAVFFRIAKEMDSKQFDHFIQTYNYAAKEVYETRENSSILMRLDYGSKGDGNEVYFPIDVRSLKDGKEEAITRYLHEIVNEERGDRMPLFFVEVLSLIESMIVTSGMRKR